MPADSSTNQTHVPPRFTTLCSTIDEIQLPLELQAASIPDLLAEDFAHWISHSNLGLAYSKLGVLCSSNFQVIAGEILGDSFVKHFRLLIWTTTLAYTAHTTNSCSTQRQNEALCKLKKLRDSYGDKVVQNLDRICRPQDIQKFSKIKRKLLFLVIVGVCLTATYTLECNKTSVFWLFNLKLICNSLATTDWI
jgi:hypothetical protein